MLIKQFNLYRFGFCPAIGLIWGLFCYKGVNFFSGGNDCVTTHLRRVRKFTDANGLPSFWGFSDLLIYGICGTQLKFRLCSANAVNKMKNFWIVKTNYYQPDLIVFVN